jgi:uncharacterized protein GlcG (DUF336 family)
MSMKIKYQLRNGVAKTATPNTIITAHTMITATSKARTANRITHGTVSITEMVRNTEMTITTVTEMEAEIELEEWMI